MTITVRRACGHKDQITISGGTAATKSAEIFHAAMEDCYLCQHEADTAETCPTCGYRLEYGFCEACFQDFGR